MGRELAGERLSNGDAWKDSLAVGNGEENTLEVPEVCSVAIVSCCWFADIGACSAACGTGGS